MNTLVKGRKETTHLFLSQTQTYHTSKPERGLFILSIILMSVLISGKNHLCERYCWSDGGCVFVTSFLKSFITGLYHKWMKLLNWLFPLAWFPFNGNKQRTSIDAGGSYCVITVEGFCTTGHKVANKIVRKFRQKRIIIVATLEDRRHCITFSSLFPTCSSSSFNISFPFFIFSHHIFPFFNFSRRCIMTLKITQNDVLVPSLPVQGSSMFCIRRCAMPVYNDLAREDSPL